jgi:Arc/MetJ-type ribon-helix-helix transcriptional regulator
VRIVTVKLPESYLEIIDRLVDLGRYASRGEFIRTAVRKLIDEELAKEHLNGMWRELRKRRHIRVRVIE